jgi:2-keto-4-pentenoate hydratase
VSGAGFDPAAPARRLAEMWRDMRQIDALPPGERPRTIEDAYAIQRRLIEEIGEPVRGYKLGQSSAAAMERNGLGAPIMGFIPESRLYESGATVEAPPSSSLLIEVELAFTLPTGCANDAGVELPARLALEIVRSRFAKRDAVDLPSFVSDGSGFHALVLGDAVPLDRFTPYLDGGASLWRNGRIVANATIGRERPDPLDVLARFRALARTFSMPVAPNMVIATGSLTVPFEARGEGQIEGRLGPSIVSFEARWAP